MPQSFERLFEIKKESLKLLDTQGYNIENERYLFDTDLEEFKTYYMKTLPNATGNPVVDFLREENLNSMRSFLSNIYTSNYSKDQKVIVYFAVSFEKKVTDVDIASFCRMIQKFNVSNAILISEVPLSSAAESLCTEFVPGRNGKGGKKYGCFIQHFEDNELFFNPLEHVYVPSHRILTEVELEEMIKVEKIRPGQLPQMSALDPIAKRLGARPGDVIEINRKILIPGTLLQEEIFYRGVYMPQKEKKDRVSKK